MREKNIMKSANLKKNYLFYLLYTGKMLTDKATIKS